MANWWLSTAISIKNAVMDLVNTNTTAATAARSCTSGELNWGWVNGQKASEEHDWQIKGIPWHRMFGALESAATRTSYLRNCEVPKYQQLSESWGWGRPQIALSDITPPPSVISVCSHELPTRGAPSSWSVLPHRAQRDLATATEPFLQQAAHTASPKPPGSRSLCWRCRMPRHAPVRTPQAAGHDTVL